MGTWQAQESRRAGPSGCLTAALAACAALLMLSLPGVAAAETADQYPPGANDFNCKPSRAHPRPVVLAHGLGGTGDTNWSYIGPRLSAQGYCVYALTYGLDPRTALLPYRPGGSIPMEQSSGEFKAFVNKVLRKTGAHRVDIVGHSEGTVMPRYYMERRNGAKKVKRFIALTPLWRGTNVAATPYLRDALAPLGLSDLVVDLVAGLCGSCPEFLRGSEYMDDLNSDGEAIPGVRHTNIITRYDELVSPYTSGLMRDGGKNIVLQRICPLDLSEHGAVAYDPAVAQLVANALDPKHSKPVPC